MAGYLALIAFVAAATVGIYRCIIHPLYVGILSEIPGPKPYAFTKWRLALEDWQGRRMRTIHQLHQQHGPAVRVGPNEIHFNSLAALRTIYGAGSGFERTDFYRMFDVYGKRNLFTFNTVKDHAERKKLLAHAYSKSNMLRGPVAEMVEGSIQMYLDLIEREPRNDIFTSLHYYSLDNITNFLYGSRFGGTSAMEGSQKHRALLDDIFHPARRRLTWLAVHFPSLTTWLYTRVGVVERLVKPFLPMQKPSIYTGIRAHALKAMQDFSAASIEAKAQPTSQHSIIARLWKQHASKTDLGLTDLEIASECADHFLAGIDTTSDTLMFLIWSLSLPQNKRYQDRLTEEARALTEEDLNAAGNPKVVAADKLPYLDAVVKETLRLFAPIPASEPRQSPTATTIDGYQIPAGTVVACSPYSLHRNPEVFPNPLEWNPDRWLGDSAQVAEMKKWWWAFSSGGRMCVGMHLALAEMTIVPAIYRKYRTTITPGFEDVSPGITSRFEVFGDETMETIREDACWIEFVESK